MYKTKENVANYAKKLKNAGICLTGAFIALRLDDIHYALTTAKADFELISDKDISILSGDELRSNNLLAYALFEQNKDVNAIIHTCPKFCCVVAQKGKDIPPVLDDMAQIVGVNAKVCDVNDRKKLLKTLGKHYACVIRSDNLSDSGAIAIGRSLDQAFTATLVLEKSAQVYTEAQYIGGSKPINIIEALIMHLVYKVKYSRMEETNPHRSISDFSRSISNQEMVLRQEIVELGKKLSEDNLVQGTWGNISVRLDDKYMLTTPSGLDYFRITPYDIVRVEIDTLEYEGSVKPTGEKTFHAALLKAHPDVCCIIHTHSVNCSVFAAAHKQIYISDKAQRILLGGDVQVAKYGLPSTKKLSKNVVNAIKDNRACVMENHGMLVCGASVDDAYEKCIATEVCARAYLDRANANE